MSDENRDAIYWESRCEELESQLTASQAECDELRGSVDAKILRYHTGLVLALRDVLGMAKTAAPSEVLSRAVTEIASLKSQLEEARRDKERLDWLEAEMKKINGKDEDIDELVMRFGQGLRVAIDAAAGKDSKGANDERS